MVKEIQLKNFELLKYFMYTFYVFKLFEKKQNRFLNVKLIF